MLKFIQGQYKNTKNINLWEVYENVHSVILVAFYGHEHQSNAVRRMAFLRQLSLLVIQIVLIAALRKMN